MHIRTTCIISMLVLSIALGAMQAEEIIIENKPLSYWIKLLNEDSQNGVRAAETLKKLGTQTNAAMPTLLEALQDPNILVRGRILLILEALGPQAKSAIPTVVKFYSKAKTPADRVLASHALFSIASEGGLEAKDAVTFFVAALKSEDPMVRSNAAAILGEIGPIAKDAIPALRDALKDENEGVREAAQKALEKIEEGKKFNFNFF